MLMKKPTEQIMPLIKGAHIATMHCGQKYKNRDDLLFMVFDAGTNVAGVFTQSLCPSAPVDHCREILPFGQARALVVNAGNANAFTGAVGAEAAKAVAAHAATVANCKAEEVYLASTGVIGEALNPAPILTALSNAVLEDGQDAWGKAAKAIMTTDTYPKYATRSLELDGYKININAIAKGSGMIAPNMATMLCFIVTDVSISVPILQSMLKKGVDKTFNNITVDSDTSTSDTILLFATGQAAGVERALADNEAELFYQALEDILQELALSVVKDGEGATHLIKITVVGAVSDSSAKKIAFSIANSPLVKTAIAGNDANWGRVVMAVGKAGEKADRDKLSIFFGPFRIANCGVVDSSYKEQDVAEYMKNYQIEIKVDIGLGQGCAIVWTCDFTEEYVKINADYRS